MGLVLPSDEQQRARAEFRAFADEVLRPHADRFDREEVMPRGVIDRFASAGHLGVLVPREHGGKGMDMISFGVLNEEIGAACSSARTLLTVHGMVTRALAQWGSDAIRAQWLPRMARGEVLGAFAATEPEVGSDLRHVGTTATEDGGDLVLEGTKRWISYGEIAHVLLVLARLHDQPVAILVEADREGVSRRPLRGMLGTRATMLAEITLRGCRVPAGHVLGRPGFGSAVMASALDTGRYSVAWGCVGIGQACLDASGRYALGREQFGRPLASHELVQRMLANMMTEVRAARLLCTQAGASKEDAAPATVVDTLVAKYFAASMAMRAATDAVQILGANGCGPDHPVARYLRDAKTMEIIEGTTEIQQMLIARHVRMDLQAHALPAAEGPAWARDPA